MTLSLSRREHYSKCPYNWGLDYLAVFFNTKGFTGVSTAMFHYCIQPQRKEQTKILLNLLEKEIFFTAESSYNMGHYYTYLGTSWVKSYSQEQNNFILETLTVMSACVGRRWLSYLSPRIIITFRSSVMIIPLMPTDASHVRRPNSSTGMIAHPKPLLPTTEVTSFPWKAMDLRVNEIGGAGDRDIVQLAPGEKMKRTGLEKAREDNILKRRKLVW